MQKRYAIHPGNIRSVHDGQLHFIGADMLIALYGVDPRECVIVRNFNPQLSPQGLHGLVDLGPASRYEDYERIRKQLHGD